VSETSPHFLQITQHQKIASKTDCFHTYITTQHEKGSETLLFHSFRNYAFALILVFPEFRLFGGTSFFCVVFAQRLRYLGSDEQNNDKNEQDDNEHTDTQKTKNRYTVYNQKEGTAILDPNNMLAVSSLKRAYVPCRRVQDLVPESIRGIPFQEPTSLSVHPFHNLFTQGRLFIPIQSLVVRLEI
jgi:hypothetical protein